MTNTQPTIPLLSTSTGPGASTHIHLAFNTAMARGTGTIFVTDGAVQTVIDRVTGQPTMRVVGASFTSEISAANVTIDGTDVKFDVNNLPAGQHYSVVMDPGVLVTTANKPFAGVRTPGQLAFQSAADAQPPGVTSVELDGSTLSAGHSIGVTITFSEAVAALDPGAIRAQNATLGNLQSADGGHVWHATLTGAAGTVSDANKVSIDMSMVRDLAGNAGSGMVSSPSYAVDTHIIAVLEPHLGINDLGAIRGDYITADDERYLSGHFTGTLGASQHIKLTIDGVAVASDAIHTEVNGETSVNGWYYEDSGKFADGVHNIKAWIEDDSGKTGLVLSQAITIDTHKPTFTSSAGTSTPFDVTSPLVITFSEPVYWDSHGADHQVIRLVNVSDNSTSEIYVDDRNLSSDRRTLTINADDLHLLGGKDYRVTLPTELIDLAGNEVGENQIGFHTQGEYVDSVAPRALRAEATVVSDWHGGSYGAGTVIDIHVRFSEQVRLVTGPAPVLGLDNGGLATFSSISADKLELIFRYTVGASGTDTTHLEITDNSGMVGRIADLAGNILTSADIDYAGLGSAIAIDTQAPSAVTTALLSRDDDTGSSNSDNITNDRTPLLTGTGAEPGVYLKMYEGSREVGHGFANDDGSWFATVGADNALSDGAHTLVVKQVDRAGNESAASPAVTVTIDAIVPAALPALALKASSDKGATDKDGITNENRPTFDGTGAMANTVIKLYANELLLGQTVSDGHGGWEFRTGVLSDGIYSVTARQFDIAGNASDLSAAVAVTIDTAPPAAPPAPVLATGSDKGVSSSDGITYITTPTLTGTALPDSVVKLYAGETEIGNGVSNAQGGWSIATSTLVDGTYSITARQFDVAGNRSDSSGPVNVRIDSAGPTVIGNHEGPKAGDFSVLFSEAITLTPGASLRVLDSLGRVVSTLLGSAPDWQLVNDDSGAASILRFHADALLPGTYRLQLAPDAIHDLAGNAAIIGQPEFQFHVLGLLG